MLIHPIIDRYTISNLTLLSTQDDLAVCISIKSLILNNSI